jgi:DNA repair protein RadC
MSAISSKVINFKICEKSGKYISRRPLTEKQIINAAKSIIRNKYSQKRVLANTTDESKQAACIFLSNYEHEVFACIFLNNKHEVLAIEEMFRGTIDGASVYPREVLKRCLEVNAAAVIFAHNHPSGNPEPGQSDINITKTLIQALALVDIRVLDHIIVGGVKTCSLAELGHI